MRAAQFVRVGAVIVVLLAAATEAMGQPPPGQGKAPKQKGAKAPPDEMKEILKQIKEAYKAPFEVHQDVLKELRKAYREPTPEREAKIFKELRRLYQPTPEQGAAILQEIRKAYQQPSAQQEERIFLQIEKADRLPPGTVPPAVQTEQAKKMFQKLDRNGDGLLSTEEIPDSLYDERVHWDANRNGFIEPEEYWAFYQSRLSWLSDQVASGQIDLELKRGGPARSRVPVPTTIPERGTVPADPEESRSVVYRAGHLPPGLPDWFLKLDTDRDAQLGLYEWKKSGWPIDEFSSIDRNDDGFITVEELLRYLAQQSRNR
jgi:hypothetical protein